MGWIAQNFRERGFVGALRYYTEAIVEFVCDLAPERRRSRYGDIDYDLDHDVDTTWATVPWRTRVRELLSGAKYQASEPGLFHEMIALLPVSLDDFTFIDLGSGKGRTLLMASDYPFLRISGLELLEELHRVAEQNIARYRSERQKCFNIVSIAGDARQFTFPQEPTVLYLFNPFSEPVLRTVLSRMKASAQQNPRAVYVIYHNLVHENVFEQQTWLKKLHRTHQFAVYRAA